MTPVLVAAACLSVQVHDGDTIRCGRERIRITAIDAPELPGSPKCRARTSRKGWCDYAKAYQARDALRRLVASGKVEVKRTGIDPYGRTLARVTVNGIDAGEFLIAKGLARRWLRNPHARVSLD